MTYQNYVIAAYCVFVAVMAWDFAAPRLQLGAQMRAARRRLARDAAHATKVELER